ncbi:ABC transporter substrate-binding protein [Conexibacter woesei]|uniref:Extracellular solute-binding protein family 5 n=1 Tax=Conexibacter woesei (strain DSM 14684 / CCUG 47730 / CIP 108061 / JCM 11494 / NBRC 100937 / ID131577) TaxID=469383 RepID=D3FAR7_CONWI|nr:ABC transporter substrate-binding protein [Conexibacter woesei]ADB51230.1 extracellular solute-binding protein family 5 [Conexibacter woesei DSM 14684]
MLIGKSAPAAAIVGALCAFAIAGCGGDSDSSSTTDTSASKGGGGGAAATGALRSGGTLTAALTAEPDYLDPARAQSGQSWQALVPICEGLYALDGGATKPQLAVGEPVLRDGGKTVTIRLRRGVRFNDGTPFDAEAVKTSLLRNHRTSVLFQGIPLEQVLTPSADTIVLKLAAPYAPLISDLAGPGGMIASPAQLEKLGDRFGDDPVCVGPFEFVSRRAGDAITLRRAPGYYDADRVKLDELVFKIMPDEDARSTSLRSGTIDVALDPADAEGLAGDDALRVAEVPGAGWHGVYFNVGNSAGMGKPLAPRDSALGRSAAVRRAFERTLDREALLSLGHDAGADVSCSIISTTSSLRSDVPCEANADPEAARQLLEEAGVETPVKAQLNVSASPDLLREAQAIQAMAREGGFEVEIDQCDVASCIKRLIGGDFDLALGGFSGFPDPDPSISPFVSTRGGFNFVGMSDPELDRLLEQARAASGDEAERRQLYARALEIVSEQLPLAVIGNPGVTVASRSDVGGFEVSASEIVDFTGAGFTQG